MKDSKASLLRDLHHGPRLLVLPNAWDPASARVFEAAGFPAVATTSSGIAYSMACLDGECIGRERMLEAVGRIAAAVSVPVTADMETGYGSTPTEVADTARLVVEAGAAGINLEDSLLNGQGLIQAGLHAEKIRAVRQTTDLVINARTDMYLRRLGEPAERFAETVRRAHIYREAGADCIFVPGVVEADTIARLVKEIGGPVNILALPGVPSLAELARIGVKRVTFGSGAMRAALGQTRRIARELLDSGGYGPLFEGALTSAEAVELFGNRPAGAAR